LVEGPTRRFALAEVQVQPPAFAATPNDFIAAIAAQSPRGHIPRGLRGEQPYWSAPRLGRGLPHGPPGNDGAPQVARGSLRLEQPYWTVLGLDGGLQQGLLGEDGALEVARGGFSLEPFVLVDGALATWADVETGQSLEDGDLPIPTVHWRRADLSLDVTAFAH